MRARLTPLMSGLESRPYSQPLPMIRITGSMMEKIFSAMKAVRVGGWHPGQAPGADRSSASAPGA